MSTPVPPRPPRRPDAPVPPGAPPTEALGEPMPPRDPWWQNEWALAAVGLVALLVGLGVGLALAKSETSTRTLSEATHTVTSTVKSTQTAVHNPTVTVTTTVPAPSTQTNGEGPAGTQHYGGSGPKNLGTITVAKESTLRWTSDGESFAITTDGSEPVKSQAHSGTTSLEPGSYRNFEVHAGGPWTITIAPGQ